MYHTHKYTRTYDCIIRVTYTRVSVKNTYNGGRHVMSIKKSIVKGRYCVAHTCRVYGAKKYLKSPFKRRSEKKVIALETC